jgi:hypothetical protein
VRTRRAGLAWTLTILTVLLVLLYAANVPFYSGSRIGAMGSWRMEHGRITLQRLSFASNESFYVAINTEGLRFRPSYRLAAWNDWGFTLPLWMPLLVVAGFAIREWRRPRSGRHGLCPSCGYPLRGLAPGATCPECGREPADAPKAPAKTLEEPPVTGRPGRNER